MDVGAGGGFDQCGFEVAVDAISVHGVEQLCEPWVDSATWGHVVRRGSAADVRQRVGRLGLSMCLTVPGAAHPPIGAGAAVHRCGGSVRQVVLGDVRTIC